MAVKGTKGTKVTNNFNHQMQEQDCRQYYTLGTDSFEEEFECDEPVDVPIERLKLTLKEEEELQGYSKMWAPRLRDRVIVISLAVGASSLNLGHIFLTIPALYRVTTIGTKKQKFPTELAFWRRSIWAAAKTGLA